MTDDDTGAVPALPGADATDAPGRDAPGRDAPGPEARGTDVPVTAPAGVAHGGSTERRGRVGRVVGGLAVLALTAGAVAAGAQLGSADATPVAAVEVQTPPSATTLGCAGTLQPPDERRRGDAAFDPSPVAPVTSVDAVVPAGPGAGALAVLDGAAGEVERAPAGGGSVRVQDVGAPLVVRAAPADEAPVVAAATTSLVTAGDLRGLSAASCVAPGVDDWLVGGATTVGSSAVLVLTNPGLTTAEVTAEIWGPNGPVEDATVRHVVAPGATQAVDLGGAAAEQRALVVHVATTGGQVVAHLQASVVEGFTPAGTDLVVAGAGPATRQVVPGVVVEESEIGAEVGPALRLLVPGDTGTTARVTLLGADGPVELPGVADVDLPAGAVVDLPLAGLAAGAWTVVVDADEPVLAAAVATRSGSVGELDDRPRVERAWSASGAARPHGAVALPGGVAARLVVGAVAEGDDPTAEGEGRARLRVLGDDGRVLSEHDVTVDAGTTGSWPVAELAEGAAGLELDVLPGADVVWAVQLEVVQDDGALVSVLAPVPVADGAAALRVREDGRATRG